MYKIFAIASAIIRTQYLPNPFESLSYGYIINLLVEPFLHLLTYKVVGLYYTKGSFPVFGSLLYLIFYSAHVGLIFLMWIFDWNIIAIVTIFIIYLLIHVFAKIFSQGSYY
jgi:hypothetical protein